MDTPVSSEIRHKLIELCLTAGVTVDANTKFTSTTQGRIHAVYFVQTAKSEFIIQRLNSMVVSDLPSFEALVNTVLAPASLSPELLIWPSSNTCVLQHCGKSWIRRKYIKGQALTAHLSSGTMEKMASTLNDFHKALTLADFRKSGYSGVNPWSGITGRHLMERISNNDRMSLNEQTTLKEWWRKKQDYISQHDESEVSSVIVHRDTKPSNFILKPDGSLVLIDFDTIGIGDPAMDLGELVRAWLTSDEITPVTKMSTSSCPYIAGDHSKKSLVLNVNPTDCASSLIALQRGYNDLKMTPSRIRLAAIKCCLLQCERFLDDHFDGDRYYSVKSHGDNHYRAQQQLTALAILHKVNGL
ncbi:MAG: aminoglycoside phosphotransferase family protein [Granulosicoccus sp.]